MSETVGQYLKSLLERRGLSQNELARRSGVPQSTINNIIHDRHQATLETFKRLADALDVHVNQFTYRALGIPLEELSQGADAAARASARETLADLTGEADTDHGTLIIEGDRLAGDDEWREAALKYAAAYPLLPEASDRITLLVDRLAQTYINLGAYDLAALLLNHADSLLINLRAAHDDNEESLAHLKSGIDEKRGWVEGYRGRFALARELFYAARGPAARAGEASRVSTTHHFPGRLAVESQMVALFERLKLPSPPEVNFDLALEELKTARQMDAPSPPNVAFGLLWEGRGLRQAGDWEDAQAYIEHSLHIFREVHFEASEAQPLLELARQPVLREASHELDDVRTQLWGVIYVNLAGTQHPYVVTQAFTLLAYCELLRGEYRTAPHLRRQVSDLCELVKRIHPHPQHPLYPIAQAIQSHVMEAMDERERAAYREELAARTAPEGRNDDPLFYWLKHFLPTSEDYTIHRRVVEALMELTA